MSGMIVTTHAAKQANMRFGIGAEQVTEWAGAQLEAASFIKTQPDGRHVYETSETRLIVSDEPAKDRRILITVMLMHGAVSSIHDTVRLTVRRELAKAERECKRAVRALEIRKARTKAELAQMDVNRLMTRSPKTSALIAGRMAEVDRTIAEFDVAIERSQYTLELAIRAAKAYSVEVGV